MGCRLFAFCSLSKEEYTTPEEGECQIKTGGKDDYILLVLCYLSEVLRFMSKHRHPV